MSKNLKFWIPGKWRMFLEFLGLRLSAEWVLLRAVQRRYGIEAAKECLALAVMLEIWYGSKPKEAGKIIKATQNENQNQE